MYSEQNQGPSTNPPGANAHPHQASFSTYAKSEKTVLSRTTIASTTISFFDKTVPMKSSAAVKICFPLSSKTFYRHQTSLLVRSPPRAAAAKAYWRNTIRETTGDDFGDDHVLLSRPVSRRRVLIFIRELLHFRLDEFNSFALNQQMFLVQRFVRGDDESFLLR